MTPPPPRRSSKVRVHDLIFQHDSFAERAFDGTLTAAILLSVLVVVLDSVPALGKTLASFLMILGYGILAVPTGIVTLELQRASAAPRSGRKCPGCGSQAHEADASYCKYCGTQL
jgi:hypothetical protein